MKLLLATKANIYFVKSKSIFYRPINFNPTTSESRSKLQIPHKYRYSLEISLQQQLETMIHRGNKKERLGLIIQTKNQIYSYRNAIYQGELNPKTGKRAGEGIIYVTDNHHFIAANQFVENKLNGNCLFFHQHAKYMYGHWRNNKPSGLTVARIGEILFIAQYMAGKLVQSKKVIVVFQKSTLGLILEVKNQGQLQILHKEAVLTSEDILRMIDSCHFKIENGQKEGIYHSLIKYIKKSLSSDKRDSPKLRLINNSHYRYGYDLGLAILFDDQFRLLSVGLHNKNFLNSFGAKYHGVSLAHKVEEGLFDGYTFAFDLESKPSDKLSFLYRKSHLSEIQFVNQIYKDPSEQYFRHFQSLLKHQIIISLVQNQKLNSSLSICQFFNQLKNDQEQQQINEKQKSLQKINLNSFSLQNFIKSPIQAYSLSQDITNLQNCQLLQNSRSSNTLNFQSLNERERLQVLKKQLYQNLKQKVKLPQKVLAKQNFIEKQRIITKSPVRIKKEVEKKMPKTLHTQINYRLQDFNFEDQELNKNEKLQSKQKKQLIPNLQRKIDFIIINEPKVLDSSSFRKSKKKIFEEYSTIKRDYSPQTQLSPFKAKMKQKILQKTPLNQQRSKSKSRERIFGGSKTPQKQKANKYSFVQQSNSIKFEQKEETQLRLKMLRTTLQAKAQNQLQAPSQLSSPKKIKNHQKAQRQDYLKRPQEKLINVGQIIKRNNGVYKNNMTAQSNQNLVQVINPNEKRNAPYLQNKEQASKTVSNTSLRPKPSQNVLHLSTSKKSFQGFSPDKTNKAIANKIEEPFELKEAQRLSDFKRRTTYF